MDGNEGSGYPHRAASAGQPQEPGRPRAHAAPQPETGLQATAAVRVRTAGKHVEVRFDRGFTPADVAAVKAVPRWLYRPEQHTWVLPDTPATWAALARSFGNRMVRSDAGNRTPESAPAGDGGPAAATGPAAPPASPPSRRPGPSSRPETDAILEKLREAIRIRDYSVRTERAYLGWVRRFLRFQHHATEPPEHLNATHVRTFLEHLATRDRLAARSRNQAASALGFMFREVLGRDETTAIPRAKGPVRVPAVLSHREVLRVLRELTGKYFLIVALLYSAGLRIEECLRLRVKDIDFELRQILVRNGKGKRDRYVPLARRAVELLRAQIARALALHARDRAADAGWAMLPGALHRKDPLAGYEPGWQFVFPASTLNQDPATKRTGRWPLHPTAVQRQVKRAVRRSGITRRATCHTFRHSFATEALRGGCDIRTLQHVMGHKDIRTTMIYLHALEQTGFHLRSPLDRDDDLDEYEPDGIGKPLAEMEQRWELAAKQWNPARRPTRKEPAPPAAPTEAFADRL